jgi:hypothetical protein
MAVDRDEPGTDSPTSGWAAIPSPKAAAAPTSQRPARGEPDRVAAAQLKSSHTMSATKKTLMAWMSARVAFSHGSEAKAKAAPAMPAANALSSRLRSSMRWPVMSTTNPLASATLTPESRFMRHATSPTGSWLHSQPSIVYSGKPVGWKIESVAGTVWASPVSQKKVDGSIVRR